jgi:hypothetical protein
VSSVVGETWWLDTSGLPDLLWARLRAFSDGTAEVFDLDGRYTTFASLEEARIFLLEDEYERADTIDAAELVSGGLSSVPPSPPCAVNDIDLVAQMLVRARTATSAAENSGAQFDCNTCGTPMVTAVRFAGPGQVKNFRFCTRCGARSEGEFDSGQLEAEPEWVVAVELPRSLSALQLAALRRAHLPFGTVSLSALRQVLAGSRIAVLGPYWPPSDAATWRDELRATGLGAEVVARRR